MSKVLDKLREAYGDSELQMVVEPYEKIDIRNATVEKLLDSVEFEEELIRQVEMEAEHHDEMARQAFKFGLRLQRAPITTLREQGMFDAENIRDIYKRIVCKTLKGFSAAEREYVKQLCMMAYWRTIERLKRQESNSQ